MWTVRGINESETLTFFVKASISCLPTTSEDTVLEVENWLSVMPAFFKKRALALIFTGHSFGYDSSHSLNRVDFLLACKAAYDLRKCVHLQSASIWAEGGETSAVIFQMLMVIKEMSDEAARCSQWTWFRRNNVSCGTKRSHLVLVILCEDEGVRSESRLKWGIPFRPFGWKPRKRKLI